MVPTIDVRFATVAEICGQHISLIATAEHAAGYSPMYQFKNSDITLNRLCALHRQLSSTENNSGSLQSWASLLLVIVISVFRQRELDGLLPAYLDP